MTNSQGKESQSSSQPSLFEQEEWCDIPGYEGVYQVSNRGRVRSLDRQVRVGYGATRTAPGKVMSPAPAGRGYLKVDLKQNGEKETCYVHHLVARVFVGDPPGDVGSSEGSYQINHKNGDITDNRPGNLEWVRREENTEHAHQEDLYLKGDGHPFSELTADNVRELRRRRMSTGATFFNLAEDVPVGWAAVKAAVRGDTWAHIQDPPPVEQ